MENDYTRGLLANVLRASAPFGTGMAAAPLLGNGGIAGLLAQQSFAQRMRDQPPPQRADTARGMLSADFGQGIRSDDPRLDLAMALATATPRAGIRAYHGSPHDFDRFDMSRIGTGEGAQAYGHGLYFAGNEGVARQYRSAGQPSYLGSDRVTAARQLLEQTGGDARAALDLANARMRATNRYSEGRLWQDVINNFDQLTNGTPGRMYEVNLRTDPSRLLDWDAPLNAQPHGQTLRTIGQRIANEFDNSGFGPTLRPDGTTVYRALDDAEFGGQWIEAAQRAIRGEPTRRVNANDSALVTAMLRDAGIPGIQYLDQGSRAAGQGTRNYVMFDDNLIEIIRKYGIAGLLGSGAGYGALSPTQEPQNP